MDIRPAWFYTTQIESDEALIERETAQRAALEQWLQDIDERIAQANLRIEANQAGLSYLQAIAGGWDPILKCTVGPSRQAEAMEALSK